ncbi:MAG: hypothetical protein J6S67_15805 [Methanobrevibacter sp.]|nr:hypothetical protein [Methanobrevibacter sp.]
MIKYKGHTIDIMYGYVSVVGYNRMFTSIDEAKKFIDTMVRQADIPYYEAIEYYYKHKYGTEEEIQDVSRIPLEYEYLKEYDIHIEVYFDMYDRRIYKEINSAVDNEMEVDADDIRKLADCDLTKAW